MDQSDDRGGEGDDHAGGGVYSVVGHAPAADTWRGEHALSPRLSFFSDPIAIVCSPLSDRPPAVRL